MYKENKHGTGGKISIEDKRDYKYNDLARAEKPYDWSVPFDIEEKVGQIPSKDQKNTSSCGGFAWSYYSYALDSSKREEKSPKFIYSRTNAPGGGSYGRDNCNVCKNLGVSTEVLCPLPNPLTEEAIIKNDTTQAAIDNAKTNKSQSYFNSVAPNIDTLAQMIRDNDGAVILMRGMNNGTWNSTYPLPPIKPTYENTWRHFLYCGKIKGENGKKYIAIKNSWGDRVGDKGWQWLSEDYFKDRNIMEAWSMVELANIPYIWTKTLRFGSVGFEVKQLQIRLNMSNPDGIFGLKTRAAVVKFQQGHGLQVDGVCGPKTGLKLQELK